MIDRAAYFREHGHSPEAARRIAIDFDGTIYPRVGVLDFPDPLPNAADAIRRLKQAGYHITIWTSRLDPEWLTAAGFTEHQMREYVEDLLRRDGIPFDKVIAKPSGVAYIDDIAIRFNDNWREIADLVLFTHGDD